MAGEDLNPILNNPYREPLLYYSTNSAGELDYGKVESGRRPFTGKVQSMPVAQPAQKDLYSIKDAAADYAGHPVTLLRKEVAAWRKERYPNTTRITRELLQFWFLNEERSADQNLFFAQQEAIETAIYLNEVAEKSNPGQNILRLLAEARIVSEDPVNNLPRFAFKMATGTGKTVVMGALILYHYFNRREYRQDTRYADHFLLVAPGITIRDRLGVLRVTDKGSTVSDDYYTQRFLVPPSWKRDLAGINAKITIVNYQAFQPKILSGNKKSPFDGKRDASGKKREAFEDWSQVCKRVLGGLPSGKRLLVLNDEAHHCYLPRSSDKRKAEGEDTQEENKRAAVWLSGIREIASRYKVAAVYDLSATPYYLTGSGYEPYSLFPWTVSDFGLIEAIESGLVKIPFLPTQDDAPGSIEMPVLRDLYNHINKDELPRAGRRTTRRRAAEEGTVFREEAPVLPAVVKTALSQFYAHYEEDFKTRRHSMGNVGDQLELTDIPPVFICVCNNTSVSKELFKYIAGYRLTEEEDSDPDSVRPGQFDLFSNFDPATRKPRPKPPTLLIDSDALENSEQVDQDFLRVFAPEIAAFKRDYAVQFGRGAADALSEAEILREVVNTVGKPNTLGAHIRCVVSVSMLTEGWDANTVTHIMGLRAFGSQLLCEQVAGRALRRRNYYLAPYDDETGEQLPQNTQKKKGVTWKFPPEYAHIIGVPFKLFKGGTTPTPPPMNFKPVRPVPDRAELEITFPNVTGYRIDYPKGPLKWSLDGLDDFSIDGTVLPTETIMTTAVSEKEETLKVEDVLDRREQEIHYLIAKDLLQRKLSADPLQPEFEKFFEAKRLVAAWYDTKLKVLGRDDKWKKLIWFHDPKSAVEHIARAVHPELTVEERIRPVLSFYNPLGSTVHVQGNTAKPVQETEHSHVNVVVIDSGWEQTAAAILDQLAADGVIHSWVKNAFLGFSIPYTDAKGNERKYQPDFLVKFPAGAFDLDEPVTLIVEISGTRFDKDYKIWNVENRWLPAVNAVRDKYDWGHWDYRDLDSEEKVKDLANLIKNYQPSVKVLTHA